MNLEEECIQKVCVGRGVTRCPVRCRSRPRSRSWAPGATAGSSAATGRGGAVVPRGSRRRHRPAVKNNENHRLRLG